MEIIIGITGASGVIYGINLLKLLANDQTCKVHLVLSEQAKQLINYETGLALADVTEFAEHYYENSELTAGIASGSKLIDGMVVVPCTMSTAAKINSGIADNLITRTADVCLKEHRKLIIVPRETPCNPIHLRNLYELSKIGVIILPAMPGFYHKPKSVDDLISFITGKILDQLGLKHNLYARWSGNEIAGEGKKSD
ncbi:UbiX family flavin prenyltransferase [[Eubacterium] cellulosolvens]